MTNLKRDKKFVKVCPRCGSTNSTLTNLIGVIGNNYLRCKDCGYEGPFIELAEKNINKFNILLKNRLKTK